MLFSSPWYFAFFALVLLALAPPLPLSAKKGVLALASCFFYAFWDYRYLGLLLLISTIDYLAGRGIARGRSRKAWLWLSIVSNLGILAYFKYYNFFVDNLNGLFSGALSLPHLEILLPAGISFYTFKTMSYVIDVYRGSLTPARSLADYVTFVTFFPELIAGPIVRASVFLPQLEQPIGPSWSRLKASASLFLLGFTKKLIADRLGTMFDPVFHDPAAFSSASAWAAVLGYSAQIYCDFSGYSDMAVASAKAIGYRLPENFRLPYLSRDITEFWRRWHMTLSFWLRDYVYIPLGGNRSGPTRTYVNLLLTMLLGGLWHGAGWNFVIWGGLHGAALAVHRATSRGSARRLPTLIAAPLTFAFVAACWIPFRCADFASTKAFVARLFTEAGAPSWVAPSFWVLIGLVVLGHVVGHQLDRASDASGARAGLTRLLDFFGLTLVRDELSGWSVHLSMGSVRGAYLALVWVLLAFLFTPTQLSPFIYFQF